MNSAPEKTAKQSSLSALEEKIDKILKYQKRAARAAIFRGVISFIFFLVFIVLPIIGGFYLAEYIKKNVDLDKITSQYKELTETVGTLNQVKDQIDDAKSMLNTDSLQNLLNGGSKPQVPATE